MFTPEAIAGYVVTAVLTIFNLAVGYLILKHFLFRPALRFIRKRQEGIRTQLAEAEDNLRQSRQRMDEADREREKARQEATRIVADARVAAQNRADSILAQAKSDAADIVQKGHVECDRMRTTVLEGMREEVAELSVRIASQVISQYMDADQQRAMVDELLDQELDARTSGTASAKASEEVEEEHE